MFKKIAILSGVLAVAASIGGCQSSGPKPATAAASTQGVTCSQCKVKYVRATTGVKPDITRTSPPVKVMECSECRTAVENFFATGKLEHSCKICGGSMEMCEGH